MLTCFSNDYGYEKVFEKCVEFYGDKNDMLILISSSGNSPNVVNAAKYCNLSDINVVTFTGFGNDNKINSIDQVIKTLSNILKTNSINTVKLNLKSA